MKDLSARVDKILKEKGKFDFVQDQGSSKISHEELRRVESTCVLDDSWVDVGGSVSKESLIRKMVPEGEERNMGTEIVSIVGVGGIGKTTLAKLVYNHTEMDSHFKLRAWVFVGDPFDPSKIARDILNEIDKDKSASNNSATLSVLVERIKDIISKENFLLVLDDVWTEDTSQWEELKNGLMKGASGSRILVTTRNEVVARMMGSSNTNLQRLELLSDEDCGMLLNTIALAGRSEKEKEKLRGIGMEIAKMCNGLPLAAKTVGSMLALKSTEREWREVLESPLLKYEDKAINNLFRVLKLSYLDLDPILKRCLLSCVHIPHGYSASLGELNNIWIACGCFEMSSINEDEVGRKGSEYAKRLAMRSFFVKSTDEEQDVRYKLHDIMHDFVIYMSGAEDTCVMMGPFMSEKVKRSPYLIAHQNNLSTNFLARVRYFSAIGVSKEEVPLLNLLQCARLLTVCGCDLEELPSEIGKLIHLRYLDLSNNPIEELPDSVTDLCNLHTLDVQGCSELRRLPEAMEKLRKLRHLIIKNTPSLRQFPKGLQKLTGLCTLSKFIAGENGSELGWLQNLNQLRGSLEIEIVAADAKDAEKADLASKIQIRNLILEFGELVKMEEILEALQPPAEIETLVIRGYSGKWFPSWLMNAQLDKLKVLVIDGFDECTMPPLAKFPCLETLVISDMKFKTLSTHEFLGIHSNHDVAFPELKQLSFSNCEQWEEWQDIEEEEETLSIFPCLQELEFERCPSLMGLPHNLLQRAKSLQTLRTSWGCQNLDERYDPDSGRDYNKIQQIPNILI